MTNPNHLCFYVSPQWRRKGIHTPLLNPWWGNPLTETSLLTKQIFDTFSFDTTCYSITDDLNAADAVLAPYSQAWCIRHELTLLEECVRTAREAGVPILVDGTGDVTYPMVGQDVYVLRYGGYRFLPEVGCIQIPLYADDLLERYQGGALQVREKGSEKPVVGFAGWARLTRVQRVRNFIKEIPLRMRSVIDTRYRACAKGVLWRQRALRVLERSSCVFFLARIRNSFSGSSKTAEGNLKELQSQMVEVILASDYALDVRGDANNSARLFEILSLGRIPVIVDTERNLPFSDEVDYTAFALIIDYRDIARLPERIAEFHKNVSPERFVEMQQNARDVFVRYFRVDSLAQAIVTRMRTMMAAAEATR